MSRNNFTYEYVIGKGGFGKVWKVDRKGGKQQHYLALKEMSKVKVYEKNSVASIINERKLLANLRHPFIINMHYAFQDRENLYIIMDYLSGGDLRYHICKQRKFDEEQTRFFISCLILALEYLHYNNIMHRDIKPENLVFDEMGYLYLTDMGIAKLCRSDRAVIDSSGTPGYMAPEVIMNTHHDLTCDYFAVGVMTYEFMFGKRPYLGKNRKEIRDQMLGKEINIKSCDVPANWSLEAADFINKLLRRKNRDRLGRNGVFELKEHAWLRNVQWHELYRKEVVALYIPKEGDNFDENYCNKPEPVEKSSYDYYLHKISAENFFQNYYFNYYDIRSRDAFFELDNINYKFVNIREESLRSESKQIESTNSKPLRKPIFRSNYITPKTPDYNYATPSHSFINPNQSHLSQKKLFSSQIFY